MAGHSVPIDFRVNPAKVSNPVERKTLLQDLLPLIEPFTGPLIETSLCEVPGGSHVALYCSDTMTLAVKLYFNGLISATVEYYTDEVNEHKISNDVSILVFRNNGKITGRMLRNGEQATWGWNSSALDLLHFRPLALLHHQELLTDGDGIMEDQGGGERELGVTDGDGIMEDQGGGERELGVSDDRILEYDVDELLFSEQTEFQKVQIYHTKSFGNMLVLDDLQNLAESDLAYTHGLMNKGLENFKEKEILILGGGDGALLWELLKEKPKYVTMIDIDDAVMRSCAKHLKSVCGDCLDNYDGEHYKIIVGDAISHMKDMIKEKRTFDYVFADLTDVPISPSPRGELWDFMRAIMNLGTELVKPDTGKYMTHATGIQCKKALTMFEEQLSSLEIPVTFTQTSHYVPSFKEKWCFYQVTHKSLKT
nr:spermine synthase-like [Cherax quadricarinatus]